MRSVILLFTLVACGAAFCQQRIPGQVGGSIPNPALDRPHLPAAPAAQSLTFAEQHEFAVCAAAIPGLTAADYLRLQYLSRQLKNRGHDVSTTKLATDIGPSGEVTSAMLRELGTAPRPRDSGLIQKWEKQADKYAANRCLADCQ
jgi:hypothetical protein